MPNSYQFVKTSLFLLIFLCLTACNTMPQEQNLRLLFEEKTGEMVQIYTFDPNTSDKELLLEFEKYHLYWFSPNGRYLILLNAAKNEILDLPYGTVRIIDVPTGELVDTIFNVGHPFAETFSAYEFITWSPDSSRFIFIRDNDYDNNPDYQINLWLYDLPSKTSTQLTDNMYINLAPAWSNDQQQIAFMTSKICGECRQVEENFYWDIAVLDIGHDQHRFITDFQSNELLPNVSYITVLCNLTWSPNDQYIAFENQCRADDYLRLHKSLFVVNVDEANIVPTIIFSDEEPMVSMYTFTWSNEKELLLGFTRFTEDSSTFTLGDYYGGLAVFDASLGINKILEQRNNLNGGKIAWSNNKKYIMWQERVWEQKIWWPDTVFINQLDDDYDLIPTITISDSICAFNCYAIWSSNDQFVAYTASEDPNIRIRSGECVQPCHLAILALEGRTFRINRSTEAESIKPIMWISADLLQ